MHDASFTRKRLERIVDDALRAAGVLGVLPTPLEAVRQVAGVVGVEPIDRLPAELVADERPLLGALWFEERTMFVNESQVPSRRRFTEAHELVHALCPWHEAVLRLDTEDELFRPVVSALESEANFGAGLLIFQGRAFAARSGDERPTIARALKLAREYGASAHATLHQLVESHRRPAAMLTVGRFPARGGSLPVWRSVASQAFEGLSLPHALPPATPLHVLVEAARTAGQASTTLRLPAGSGLSQECVAEAYYNRHAFLVVITSARGRTAAAA